MKSTHCHRNVSLALETLEDRSVPATNLTATITGGTLLIQGNSDHHHFVVKVLDNGISVQPFKTTIVNGVTVPSSHEVFLPGDANVIQALQIITSQGNDQISVEDHLTVSRSLDVEVRSGNATDIIAIAGFQSGNITGDINVFSEGGNDKVYVSGDLSNAVLGVNLGAGDDSLWISGIVGAISSLDGGNGKKDTIELPSWVYDAFASSIKGFEKITRT